jgi:type VI secretion system protein ImpM
MPPLPPDARAGLFGKLPARGDFVRKNLPRDFTDAWDAWWQRGLAETQRRSPDGWRDAWLEAPVWRFVLPPGLCGANGVLGLWMPSVDRAGRYSPLTIAATTRSDWASYVGPMMRFLEDAETAGRDALEQDLSPAALLERIQEAFIASDAPSPALDLVPGQAAWWTEGGPRVAARLEAGATLPEGSRFAALIDDRWSEAQPAPALSSGSSAEPS